MRKFKLFDYLLNIILISASLIYGLLAEDFHFIYGYFIVGAWQVISMFIHYFNDWFNEKGTGRRIYQKTILYIFITAAIGMLVWPLLYLLLVILLFAAPFLAIYYTWLCYRELYVKMQRPLAMLK